MQDLSKCVGIKSNAQVALEEDKITLRTSSVVAGAKAGKDGGETSGGM